MRRAPPLFRKQHDGEVSYIELFFDLVFVFAITQLSHFLSHHPGLASALEGLVMLLAVWWVWIYTCWVTNWLDCDRAMVRLMLLAMMLGGLALSSAIPDAFGAGGLRFALAYCGLQIGRSIFLIFAASVVDAARTRNAMRLTFWFLLATPLWIWGATATPEARLAAWAAAIAIEYAGPFLRFATPFLGTSTLADWDVSGHHMAERCALFIIIALGEAVLVTGTSYVGIPADRAPTAALVTSFVGSAAMWWIYFDIGAKRGRKMIEQATQAGLVARNAYTYLHLPIVAGLVVTAVGDALMLDASDMAVTLAEVLAVCGGPWLFLAGCIGFKWSTSGQRFPPASHGFGVIALAIIGYHAWHGSWTTLETGRAATSVLIATAIWEWLSLNGGWQRWAPWSGVIFSRFPPPR
jgi:low temperature requirement protein LtrA